MKKLYVLISVLVCFFAKIEAKEIKAIPVRFNQPEILNFELLTEQIDMGQLDPLRMNNEIPSAIKIKVNSNVNWALYIMAMNDFINERGERIESDKFEFRIGKSKFIKLKKGNLIEVASSKSYSVEINNIVSIDVRFNANINSSPGDYKGNINFILDKKP
ncbi:hypothetical protein KAU43_05670 [candidate division WOR-3 bacterium]|nr:hypothetical protein [candidate division WOR-3 bacterium]